MEGRNGIRGGNGNVNRPRVDWVEGALKDDAVAVRPYGGMHEVVVVVDKKGRRERMGEDSGCNY